jgi:hypothetical protein
MDESRHWFILALIAGTGWLVYQLAPVITPFVMIHWSTAWKS